MKTQRITLKQVAELAGCSTAAVSCVLTKPLKNVGVSPDLRQRISRIAAESGYRTNLAGRAMRDGRSFRIGALIQNAPGNRTVNPVAFEYLLGINEGLSKSNYTMSVVRACDVIGTAHPNKLASQGHTLDAIIAVGAIPTTLEAYIGQSTQVCIWLDGNVWKSHNCIRRDEIQAGCLAAEVATSRGYQEIIVISRPRGTDHFSYEARMRGIVDTVTAAGARLTVHELPWTDPLKAWPTISSSFRTSIAIIVLDAYALETLLCLLTLTGLRPGIDVEIVCCDDSHSLTAVCPFIERVLFDRTDMGMAAAAMALQALNAPGNEVASQLYPVCWKTN